MGESADTAQFAYYIKDPSPPSVLLASNFQNLSIPAYQNSGRHAINTSYSSPLPLMSPDQHQYAHSLPNTTSSLRPGSLETPTMSTHPLDNSDHSQSSPELEKKATTGKAGKAATEKRVPRPSNSWLIYRSAKIAEQKEQHGNYKIPQKEVSRLIAEQWRAEPPHVKQYYEELAETRKRAHEAQYPNYRYKPQKRRAKSAFAVKKQKSEASLQTTRPALDSNSSGSASSATQAQGTPAFNPIPLPLSNQQDGFYISPQQYADPSLSQGLSYWSDGVSNPISMPFTPVDSEHFYLSPLDSPLDTPAYSPAGTLPLPSPSNLSSESYYSTQSAPDYFYTYPSIPAVSSGLPLSAPTQDQYPDWWQFRNTKVVRDEDKGEPLQHLLHHWAWEAEGQSGSRQTNTML